MTAAITHLTLQTANAIIAVALAEGQRLGLAPLCVAVLDAGAHLLALQRNERASLLRPQIATGKAAGALGMGFGGRELARRAATMPAFFGALSDLSNGHMVPVPGGVLIRSADGQLLGAVGISGDTSENDELCALAGVAAVGLEADAG